MDKPPFFDPWWRAREGSRLKAFATTVADGLPYERRHASLNERVEAIIVDLVRRHGLGDPVEISVQMGKPYYGKTAPRASRLHATVETEALIDVVRKLAAKGRVTLDRGRQPGKHPWEATTISAGAAILREARRRGATGEIIEDDNARTHASGRPALILKAADKGEFGVREEISFQESPEVERLRSDVDDLNGWYAALSDKISFEGIHLSTRERHLHRVFHARNHEDGKLHFDRHGRLYGAFWVNLNKADRHALRLDGERVAILDYGQSFLRIAYAETAKTPPEGDLYDILGLEGYARDAIKAFINAMLNTGHALTQYPEDDDVSLREHFPGIGAKEVARRVREHHKDIAWAFPTTTTKGQPASGPRLTFLESEIMLEVLRNCRAGWRETPEGTIPALPLHDGLMVPWSKQRAVGVFMWEAFERRFGQGPLVTCSPPDDFATTLVDKVGLSPGSARAVARSKGPFAELVKALSHRFGEGDHDHLVKSHSCRPRIRHLQSTAQGLDFGPPPRRRREITSGIQRPLPEWARHLPRWPGKLEPPPEGHAYNRRTLERHQRRIDGYYAVYEQAFVGGRVRELTEQYASLPDQSLKKISYGVELLSRQSGLGSWGRVVLLEIARSLQDLGGGGEGGMGD